METFSIQNLSFTYPERLRPALHNISLDIHAGEFVALIGSSGCGKSTLLKQLKPSLTPSGRREGQILFQGGAITALAQRRQAAEIGYVLQNPENQTATDKVWHELAFGLESLGYDNHDIRGRVAEMAGFFGIEDWFHQNVAQLSGGQKQLLNLASIMVMDPIVLLLDEPTSQLDPIACEEFLHMLVKINRELGVTIIISEHRLEEVLPLADRMIVLEQGRVIADGAPRAVGGELLRQNHGLRRAMPAAWRMWAALDGKGAAPLTVRQGRDWLRGLAAERTLDAVLIPPDSPAPANELMIDLSEVWFRYEKEAGDVLRGLSLRAYRGELLAIVGGNGCGKTTLLKLLLGKAKAQRGRIKISDGKIAMLAQNPQHLSVKARLADDLAAVDADIDHMARLCGLSSLLQYHPYDLSGGEQQKAALAKVLLTQPDILLLDEPTKGLDAVFKQQLAMILQQLRREGVTVIMVSHDLAFCAQYASRCALMFDGAIIAAATPRKFFADKRFYTTAANRIARGLLPTAVLTEDVILAGKGEPEPMAELAQDDDDPPPPGPPPTPEYAERQPADKRQLPKRTAVALLMLALVIPLTIWAGIVWQGDRRYYIISMLLIIEAMLPFVLVFEGRRPQAREIIVIAVLVAIAVAGRAAFFMVPQFKPIIALVIIAGVCFGGETGFLVGALTGFCSNFFFGQGPWTPWQMFVFGLIGFLAGVLFRKGLLKKNRRSLCVFGGLATLLIFGGIINPASILMFNDHPTWEMILAAYALGLPLDLIHAVGTMVFLLLAGKPMIAKLERIKIKYGLII